MQAIVNLAYRIVVRGGNRTCDKECVQPLLMGLAKSLHDFLRCLVSFDIVGGRGKQNSRKKKDGD